MRSVDVKQELTLRHINYSTPRIKQFNDKQKKREECFEGNLQYKLRFSRTASSQLAFWRRKSQDLSTATWFNRMHSLQIEPVITQHGLIFDSTLSLTHDRSHEHCIPSRFPAFTACRLLKRTCYACGKPLEYIRVITHAGMSIYPRMCEMQRQASRCPVKTFDLENRHSLQLSLHCFSQLLPLGNAAPYLSRLVVSLGRESEQIHKLLFYAEFNNARC